MAPWVSCNWPATSMTFSATGEDGIGGAAAARAPRVAPNGASPAAPAITARRLVVMLFMVASPHARSGAGSRVAYAPRHGNRSYPAGWSDRYAPRWRPALTWMKSDPAKGWGLSPGGEDPVACGKANIFN